MPLNTFDSKDELNQLKNTRIYFTVAMMVSLPLHLLCKGQLCRIKMLPSYRTPTLLTDQASIF